MITLYINTLQIDNYFVAVGMNGNSLQGMGGAGKAIAEWIVYGTPSTEMLPFDVRRFIDLHNNRRYLKERTREIVSRYIKIYYYKQRNFLSNILIYNTFSVSRYLTLSFFVGLNAS